MIDLLSRIKTIRKKKSLFCVGLDPSIDQLRAVGLPENATGIFEYCQRIIEASSNEISIFKPQYAYFERFGIEGINVLCEVLGLIRESDSISILDCKKCDIGLTMQAYAQGLIGFDSAFNADAVTAVAYFGFEALRPLMDHAKLYNCFVFVVVSSSNPEGADLQFAKYSNNETIAEHLINKVNQSKDHVGAVIGATLSVLDNHVNSVIKKLDNIWVLAPGIGAQGACIKDLEDLFGHNIPYIIPSASRSITSDGLDIFSIQKKIIDYKSELLRMYDKYTFQ